MKRALIVAFAMLGSALLAEVDFGQIYVEAEKAAKAKDFVTAEAKYGEALKVAQSSKQKCDAIIGKFRALRGQKKIRDAEKFAIASVESETLEPLEIRHILNTVAGTLLWSPRTDFALDLMKQAQNIECPKKSNVYYKTYFNMASLYRRKHMSQEVIEVLENVTSVKEQHPANLYTANMMTGAAYEDLGKKEDALKHYKAALEYGKKVKYKFAFSAAEQAVERLNK